MPEKRNNLILNKDGLGRVDNQLQVTNKILQLTNNTLIPFREKDKWGFCDRQKKIIIPCKYDWVSFFKDCTAEIRIEQKIGLIDIFGNEFFSTIEYDWYQGNLRDETLNHEKIIECDYFDFSFIPYWEPFAARHDGYWGLINRKFEEITPCIYDEIDENFIDRDFAKVVKDGYCGFINIHGVEVVPCVYEIAWDFDCYGAIVQDQGKWGVLGLHFQLKVPCKYDSISKISGEDLFQVTQNGKYGLINIDGAIILSCIYNGIGFFDEGYTCVNLNNKYGIIDNMGNEIIPYQYDYIPGYYNGLIPVELHGKWGLIDIHGIEVIPIQFDKIEFFNSWSLFFKIKRNDKCGLFDKQRKILSSIKYDDISISLSNSELAKFKMNNKWGVIDKAGNEIIQCLYDDIDFFSTERKYFEVTLGNKKGIIDFDGRILMPIEYDKIRHCSQSQLFIITKNNLSGFFSILMCKQIVPCKYIHLLTDEYTDDFEIARGQKEDFEWELIDKSGKVMAVIPNKFNKIYEFYFGYAAVEMNNKFGFIDKHGALSIPCKYDELDISPFNQDTKLFKVKHENKWGAVDPKGIEYWEE